MRVSFDVVLQKLATVATFVPEFEGPSAFSDFEEDYSRFIRAYPQITGFEDYLAFLRTTGGAHIFNEEFSLGLYGFGGFNVTSFWERNFLDEGRYLVFGEVLYFGDNDTELFFAFDLTLTQDVVYATRGEAGRYFVLSPSFRDLMERFASGSHPGLDASGRAS